MYKISSEFNLSQKKGYSFGKAERNRLEASKTPGPARYYDRLNATGYKSSGYSFGKDEYRTRVKTEEVRVGV